MVDVVRFRHGEWGLVRVRIPWGKPIRGRKRRATRHHQLTTKHDVTFFSAEITLYPMDPLAAIVMWCFSGKYKTTQTLNARHMI